MAKWKATRKAGAGTIVSYASCLKKYSESFFQRSLQISMLIGGVNIRYLCDKFTAALIIGTNSISVTTATNHVLAEFKEPLNMPPNLS